MRQKNEDYEAIAANLDITPTMHKYAIDRYTGIAEYLKEKEVEAHIYPQGSFRTGTVVRPIKENIEQDYDIDVVCELDKDKNMTGPKDVKMLVGDTLKSSLLYKEKLLAEQDKCWTLQYAKVSGEIGLLLDIVPCVKEDAEQMRRLIGNGVEPVYASQAVAITDKKSYNNYCWGSSNPNGYGDWFDSINDRFLKIGLSEKKARLLKENQNIFAANTTVEDVPDYYVKSSLQRVIQLLKRHRDIYYSRIKNGEENIPASVIITTLATKFAQSAQVTDTYLLLEYIVKGLEKYASLMWQDGKSNQSNSVNFIEKTRGKWQILNPVNPEDNYADSWTDETAKCFFAWLNTINQDLIIPMTEDERKYFGGLSTSFGEEYIKRVLSSNSIQINLKPSLIVAKPIKPWGE